MTKRAASINALNRSGFIVIPKQPFLDWVNALDTGAPPLTLEEVRKDSSMYLIPEFENDEAEAAYVAQSFDDFFKEQLSSWWTEEAAWPQHRTLELFQEWFEYRAYSLVLDLVKGRLVRAAV